jgi:hypothetical protein
MNKADAADKEMIELVSSEENLQVKLFIHNLG